MLSPPFSEPIASPLGPLSRLVEPSSAAVAAKSIIFNKQNIIVTTKFIIFTCGSDNSAASASTATVSIDSTACEGKSACAARGARVVRTSCVDTDTVEAHAVVACLICTAEHQADVRRTHGLSKFTIFNTKFIIVSTQFIILNAKFIILIQSLSF